jgi:hypothetical protein
VRLRVDNGAGAVGERVKKRCMGRRMWKKKGGVWVRKRGANGTVGAREFLAR